MIKDMKLPETYLIERFVPEVTHILEILTQTKDKTKFKDDPNYSYYYKLADWGVKHKQKTGKIELDKIKLSYKEEVIQLGLPKYAKDLWSMINTLIKLMEKHNSNKESAKVIQQTTLEILAGLSKLPIPKTSEKPKDDEEEEDDSTKPEPKSGKSRDWTAYRAKKLASVKPTSKALNEFYDEYYSQEYAGVNPTKEQEIVAKLKSLDKILILEFNKLGYNPEVNPFASFIKILIKEKFDIFEKLTTNTYGAIHNSFIEKYITGNMLGQKFDETNILFCSDLYNKNGLDIVEYLYLQKQAIDAKKESAYVDDVNLIAKIFIQQSIDGENYTEKVNNLLKSTAIVTPGTDDAKLRSILEIQELYRHVFKATAKQSKTKVNAKTVIDIVTAAEEQNIMLAMIKLILAQNEYAGSTKYATTAQEIENWLDKRNYSYTKDNIVDCRKILLNYALNAEALNLIIMNLKNRIEEQTENKN